MKSVRYQVRQISDVFDVPITMNNLHMHASMSSIILLTLRSMYIYINYRSFDK